MKIAKEVNGLYLVFEEKLWTGKRSLIVNDQVAEQINKRTFYVSINNESIEFTIKGDFLTGITLLSDENEKFILSKNTWYDWILIFLPFTYLFLGIFYGAIGGFLSTLAAFICGVLNVNILRSNQKIVVKVILCLLSYVALFAIWFVIVLLIALIFS